MLPACYRSELLGKETATSRNRTETRDILLQEKQRRLQENIYRKKAHYLYCIGGNHGIILEGISESQSFLRP